MLAIKTKEVILKISIIFILIGIVSCGPYFNVATLDSETGRFPENKNSTLTVLKSTKFNADTLKRLIIVPNYYANKEYWKEMVTNMKYFNEVMTYSEFKKDIIAKGLDDEIRNISDPVGLNVAYRKYKPFVVLGVNREFQRVPSILFGNLTYYGFTLFDPLRGEYFFENTIFVNGVWDGDARSLYPLFNSLLDYLREQK